MSAYQRLFVWFGSLAALGALGFVVVWLYGLPFLGIEGVYSLEHRRAIVAMESLADRERDAFERWFGNYRRELRVLVNSSTLLAGTKSNARPAPQTQVLLERKLNFLKDLGSSGYETIYLTDASGEHLFASTEASWKTVPFAHKAQLRISRQPGVVEFVHVLYDEPVPSLLIVHQLIGQDAQGRPSGELLGLLVAKVGLLAPLAAENLNALDKELGSHGALLLFDAWGRVLANSNANESNENFRHIGKSIVAEAEDVRILPTEQGDETIAVFRHLHIGISEGVSLVMVSHTDEVLAATQAVFWRIAALGSAIFALAVGLVFFAARQIARGEAAVYELNATLEQRVVERTEQLSQSNWQLMKAMQDLESTRDDLVRSEKLAALGALVAGIAHEMNTPLGNAVLVATTLQENETHFAAAVERGLTRNALDEYMAEHAEGLALLSSNLNRASALVSSFKQLAVDQTSEQRRQFDVDAMIEEVIMVMSPTLRRSRHRLSTEVAAGISMDSFPGPLEQVLVNFINNALLHAFPEGSTGHMHIQASLHNQEVKIVFSDDGCGMDEETQKRAFDPFFTTRLGQGGNGLGLHIAYSIVTALLGGRIELVSTSGSGTRFTLYLPQVAPLTQAETA